MPERPHRPDPAPSAQGERLALSLRLGYGVGDVGASLSFVAVNTWLLYYLVNIAGMPPFRAGLVFVIGRVFDAALDPVMGVASDRLKLRVGRKPFILWGAVPLGAAFAALWWLPAAHPAAAFALALAAFLAFSLLYTVVQVPYMALTPELARGYDARTTLSSFRIAFGTLASLLAVALPPLLVLAGFPGGVLASSRPAGWVRMGGLFAVLTSGAYLVMYAAVPEPRRRPEAPRTGSGWRDMREVLAVPGFRTVLALFVAATVGIMIVNSMLPFALESALRIPGPQQTPLLGLLFGVAILSFPAWTAVSARWSKRTALAAGLLVLAVALVPMVLAVPPGGIGPLLLLLTALAGCGLSAVMLLPWAMLPDVVEFDEARSGRRREGVAYALFTFGQKTAGSIGVFANAIAASLFGYQQGVALQQPGTVWGIRLMTGPVAAAVFLVALVLTLRYPITRAAHTAVRAELAERRGGTAEERAGRAGP